MKKQIPFGIYIIIIVCMALATFVEKVYGTDVTFSLIYNSWWFICLWIFLAIAGFLYMLKKSHYKCKSSFLIAQFVSVDTCRSTGNTPYQRKWHNPFKERFANENIHGKERRCSHSCHFLSC